VYLSFLSLEGLGNLTSDNPLNFNTSISLEGRPEGLVFDLPGFFRRLNLMALALEATVEVVTRYFTKLSSGQNAGWSNVPSPGWSKVDISGKTVNDI